MLLNPRILFISLAFALHAEAAAQDSQSLSWKPTLELVRQVEAKVTLPKGAHPLMAYRRHYAGVVKNSKRVLLAVYVLARDNAKPGVSIEPNEESLPIVLDGGCDIVSFDLIDPEGGVPIPSCNGVA